MALTLSGSSPSLQSYQGGAVTSGTAITTTSGTAASFTSIPSWVKRITIMLNAVSTSATSNLIVQIGSGSYTATGYVGVNTQGNAGVTTTTMSTGFLIATGVAAGSNFNGSIVLTNLTGNIWTETGLLGQAVSTAIYNNSSGSVTIGGTLDRVQVTTVNGTDTFDAGSINILYE